VMLLDEMTDLRGDLGAVPSHEQHLPNGPVSQLLAIYQPTTEPEPLMVGPSLQSCHCRQASHHVRLEGDCGETRERLRNQLPANFTCRDTVGREKTSWSIQ
jgi:hypothetical protein